MDAEKIGKLIQYLRKRLGYTQHELANRLSVSDKAVSKWERGMGIPDISLLQKLSVILDVDIDSLLSGEVSLHDQIWKGALYLDEYATSMLYDKLVFDYLLSYFLLCRVKDILVWANESQVDILKNQYRNGDLLGINIDFRVKRNEKTICDEIIYAKDYYGNSNIMMLNGSCVIYGVDLSRFLCRGLINPNTFSILTYVSNDFQNSVYFNEELKLSYSDDRSIKTNYIYSMLPILFVKNGVKALSMYQGKDFFNLVNQLIKNEGLAAEIMDKGYVSYSIDSEDALLDASLFIKLVQKNTKCIVSCLEEIAYRRGLISIEFLKAVSDPGKKNYLAQTFGF